MDIISCLLCRLGLFSESQRIKHTIELETKDIPDARTYLLTLKEIRIKYVTIYSSTISIL